MATTAARCSHNVVILWLALLLAFSCQVVQIIPIASAREPPTSAPSSNNPNEKVFNVLEHGAFRDGETPKSLSYDPELYDSPEDAPQPENCQFFKSAWLAACQYKGKARFVIPEGNFTLGPMIFPGPCTVDKPLILEVVGTIKASTDMSEFAEPYWLSFENLDGFQVTGRGKFDGQGVTAWNDSDCSSNNNCQMLPSTLKFNNVSNGVVTGITSLDPKGDHIFITKCSNIKVEESKLITQTGSPKMSKTDGIRIADSNNVTVTKIDISAGLACIRMIEGSSNVSINQVSCYGHGISIQGFSEALGKKGMSGITVKNCSFLDAQVGVSIKARPGSTADEISSIVFQDLNLDNVSNPIIIDQEFCPAEHDCSQGETRAKVNDIRYENIRGTSASEIGVKFECSAKSPCEKIQLKDIDLKCTANKPITAQCINAKAAYAGTQNPSAACR